jgi:hypothetical protein
MIKDLPGQQVMFPDLEAVVREERRADAEPMQPRALVLPSKPTCTVGEAAAATGISKRQLRYYVEDGTLLAVNSARVPVGSKSDAHPTNKFDSWRIVVRRSPEFHSDGTNHFLTLAEFVRSRFNNKGN